jgi:uncharacterized protein DUF928
MKGRWKAFWLATALLGFAIATEPSQEPPQSSKPKPDQTTSSHSKKATKSPRKRVVTDLSGFDLLEPSKLGSQTTVVGATRGLPSPVALAPRLGKLFGTTPEFAWSYEGKAQKFVFVLRDDAEKEVFRTEVSGTGYRYPSDAPSFEAGKTYFWTVEAESGPLSSTPSAPAGILVLAPDQREEVGKKLAQFAGDSYEAGLARARVFTDFRLWYEALNAYTSLIARYPDRGDLFEQRGTIYAQLDLTQKLAEQDFKRAEELRHEN